MDTEFERHCDELRTKAEAALVEPDAGSVGADESTIHRLAALAPIGYDRVRKAEAKAMGVRPETLDKVVAAARQPDDDIGIPDVESWETPVVPAEVLAGVASIVRRFIVCDEDTATAVALWVAMTWFMNVVQVAPLAVITAPEKRCGKSQLLFVMGRLVRRPLAASNISPSAIFRVVDAWQPTLMIDETDAFLRENEELRGIINAGHTRDGAYVVRIAGEGKDLRPQRFNCWGAKALAGIGHLADTLMDRSVVIELRRKLPHEVVERLRHCEPEVFGTLSAKLARFAEDCREQVRHARPDLPGELHDRAQDNWEPLLAIADIAGGDWPALGRKAALKLSGVDTQQASVGAELLADIKAVFDTKAVDRLSTAELINALGEDDEMPWSTYNRGNPISPRQLSRKLEQYRIRSKNLRLDCSRVQKGYERDQFDEAFSRYLETPQTSATPLHRNGDGACAVAEPRYACATEAGFTLHAAGTGAGCSGNNGLRSGTESAAATLEAPSLLGCSGVADKTVKLASNISPGGEVF